MCTVTFIARRRGYCLGMNRDEKFVRPAGLPPSNMQVNGQTVLCPSEPGGGTWIALNDSGASLALINWYSVTTRVKRHPLSRGEIVKTVSATTSPDAAYARLRGLPLGHVNPFRLIGIFPATSQIHEWRWDLQRLGRKKHPWKTQQWISSGFDEPTAQRVRNRTFQRALRQQSAGGTEWLRRLHRSHKPQPGPFSTCMHRADAMTVSYVEIAVSASRVAMSYHPGPPCRCPNPTGKLRVSRTATVSGGA
jgi:hypothetical protein